MPTSDVQRASRFLLRPPSPARSTGAASIIERSSRASASTTLLALLPPQPADSLVEELLPDPCHSLMETTALSALLFTIWR